MILANDVAPVLKDVNDHDEAAGEAASTPAAENPSSLTNGPRNAMFRVIVPGSIGGCRFLKTTGGLQTWQ